MTHIVVRPTDRTSEEDAVSRLADNLEKKLETFDAEADIVQTGDDIIISAAEEDAPDVAVRLSQTPGVDSVGIAQKGVGDPISSAMIADVMGSVAGGNPFMIKNDPDRSDVLKEVETAESGVPVYVVFCNGAFYAYRDPIDGFGGVPIDPSHRALVLMDDRAATVAAAEMMREGYRVYPIYTGTNRDALEEDLRTLNLLDPAVKLTTFEADTDIEALEMGENLFGTHVVVFGDTADDDPRELPHDFKALYPNEDRDTDTVLDTYGALLHPEF